MGLPHRIRAALAGLFAALLCACGPTSTTEERAELLSGYAQYFEPPNPGPAPLVILVSGCGGLVGADGKPNTIMETYAKAAARSGAYAIIVDSFRPRGIGFEGAVGTVCSGMRLRGRARSGDILAAEALAEAHWKVDFTGIVLSGWSHGGWAIMELLAGGPDATKLGQLKVGDTRRALSPDAVTLFYPYCGFLNRSGGRPWSFQGPLLLITAEGDMIGSLSACTSILETARPGMGEIESISFPGVTHAFDEKSQSAGSAFVFDPDAAAKAETIFSDFIAQQVARLK